jgi:biofilm PGA synthesis N-glycosyltransferase PgaC
LHKAGWWSPESVTDDVDVSWRLQLAGWRLVYEPKAICWILMPETVRGLWRQRLRWSVGGTQTVLDSTPALLSGKRWRLLPIWINYVVSILWAYAIVIGGVFWVIAMVGIPLPDWAPIFSPIPGAWGIVLAATYLVQSGTSVLLDSKFESRFHNVMFWIIWYPVLFWTLQALTAFVGLPKALLRRRGARGTWVSPDRGIR